MEDQPRLVLETLVDFCENGDVMSLVKGNSTLLPQFCTQISKIGFYLMIKQLKNSMSWMNKQTSKAAKAAGPKVFDKLIKLKYGLKKTTPMKGGINVAIVEKFLNAVDKTRGQRTKAVTINNASEINLQKHGVWGYGKIDAAATIPKLIKQHVT